MRGTRYVMPGDYATVEADGSITLLGRGSIVINSGGEKIFPEEVESAVRSHPDVMDAIVCGAPDERWGQTVAAIIQPRVGHEAPSLESIQEHCRESIAGYKLPRRLYVVDAVERSPSGKPDYTWAAAIVNARRATLVRHRNHNCSSTPVDPAGYGDAIPRTSKAPCPVGPVNGLAHVRSGAEASRCAR